MRRMLLIATVILLSGCRIVISVPEQGDVDSESSAFDCAAGETCEIDVVDLFFSETFSAQPPEGQLFLGWKKRDRGLCGGSTDACSLSTAGFEGNDLLEQILFSDEEFYLEPVFGPEGGSSFNLRYCEVLIARLNGDTVEAEVWGTQSLNDCPEAEIRALDPEQIAADNNANFAVINGPRYWVIDELRVVTIPPGFRAPEDIRQTFGGVEMRLITSVQVAAGDAAASGSGSYQVAEVARDTVFTFFEGRRVYELTDPDGQRYLMQSLSQAVRKGQHITELVDLGGLLDLPEGWSFRSYVLEQTLELPAVDGIARVVTDNFSNTYQLLPE